MFATINYDIITFHKTRAAAEALAAANQAHDDDAEYRVEEAPRGFYVAIYEDGEKIGTL